MARRMVFDDWRSWIHFALGIFAGASKVFATAVAPAIALALVIAFIAYEAIERERGLNKLGDFIEMLSGFVVGYLISLLV